MRVSLPPCFQPRMSRRNRSSSPGPISSSNANSDLFIAPSSNEHSVSMARASSNDDRYEDDAGSGGSDEADEYSAPAPRIEREQVPSKAKKKGKAKASSKAYTSANASASPPPQPITGFGSGPNYVDLSGPAANSRNISNPKNKAIVQPSYAKAPSNLYLPQPQAPPSYLAAPDSLISAQPTPAQPAFGSQPQSPQSPLSPGGATAVAAAVAAVREVVQLPPGVPKVKFSDLKLLEKLATGSFGEAWKALYFNAPVVVKILLDQTQLNEKSFIAEAELLAQLLHPQVVPMIGAVVTPKLCLVMRYAQGGTIEQQLILKRAIDPNGTLKDRLIVAQMAVDLACAMDFLHSREPPVIHRDLATRNCLLTETQRVWLNDFGMSRVLKSQEEDMGKTMSVIGPVKWMSPESLVDKVYSTKTDVWMFGVTLWEMFARSIPYKDLTTTSKIILQVCTRGNGLAISPNWPEPIRQVIDSALQTDPSKRPTMNNVYQTLQLYLKSLELEAGNRAGSGNGVVRGGALTATPLAYGAASAGGSAGPVYSPTAAPPAFGTGPVGSSIGSSAGAIPVVSVGSGSSASDAPLTFGSPPTAIDTKHIATDAKSSAASLGSGSSLTGTTPGASAGALTATASASGSASHRSSVQLAIRVRALDDSQRNKNALMAIQCLPTSIVVRQPQASTATASQRKEYPADVTFGDDASNTVAQVFARIGDPFVNQFWVSGSGDAVFISHGSVETDHTNDLINKDSANPCLVLRFGRALFAYVQNANAKAAAASPNTPPPYDLFATANEINHTDESYRPLASQPGSAIDYAMINSAAQLESVVAHWAKAGTVGAPCTRGFDFSIVSRPVTGSTTQRLFRIIGLPPCDPENGERAAAALDKYSLSLASSAGKARLQPMPNPSPSPQTVATGKAFNALRSLNRCFNAVGLVREQTYLRWAVERVTSAQMPQAMTDLSKEVGKLPVWAESKLASLFRDLMIAGDATHWCLLAAVNPSTPYPVIIGTLELAAAYRGLTGVGASDNMKESSNANATTNDRSRNSDRKKVDASGPASKAALTPMLKTESKALPKAEGATKRVKRASMEQDDADVDTAPPTRALSKAKPRVVTERSAPRSSDAGNGSAGIETPATDSTGGGVFSSMVKSAKSLGSRLFGSSESPAAAAPAPSPKAATKHASKSKAAAAPARSRVSSAAPSAKSKSIVQK